MNNIYPIVLKPMGVARGSHIVKGGRGGKNKKQGPSELVSFARICRLGGKALREDVVVALEGHRYEPDLAYVDTKRGIYLDIEIDEPYSTSGLPTHYVMANGVPKDGERNRRFQQAGWHVVRFCEEQIFCHTASCLKVIYTLLMELGAVNEIPPKVQDAPNLEHIQQWTEQQSLDMKKQHYRRNYLNFDPQRMNLADMAQCVKVGFPILLQSTHNSRVRRMLFKTLLRHFSR